MDFKVLDSIIRFVTVYMVNNLIRCESPANVLFHHDPMLMSVFVWTRRKHYVACYVYCFSTAVQWMVAAFAFSFVHDRYFNRLRRAYQVSNGGTAVVSPWMFTEPNERIVNVLRKRHGRPEAEKVIHLARCLDLPVKVASNEYMRGITDRLNKVRNRTPEEQEAFEAGMK